MRVAKPSARQSRISRGLPLFIDLEVERVVDPSLTGHYAFLHLLSKHQDCRALVFRKTTVFQECCIDYEMVKQLPFCLYVLSNTAQLLNDVGKATTSPSIKVVKFQEALWLFELCIKRQLRYFDKYNAPEQAGEDVEMEDTEAAAGSSQAQSTPVRTELWARQIEPITKDTIVDTLVSQLDTLTQFIEETLPTNEAAIDFIADYFKDVIGTVLRRFDPNLGNRGSAVERGVDPRGQEFDPAIELGERVNDIKLAIANYECALANLQYNAKKIDLSTYESKINNAYGFDMSNNPQALCDAAETLVDFHEAVSQMDLNFEPYLSQRWKILSHALEFLSMAVKLPDCENKANIYTKRGDIELLRFQLGRDGVAYRNAVQNKDTILKNAGKHYRGAMIFALQEGSIEKHAEAELRSALAEAFLGNKTKLMDEVKAMEGFDRLLLDAVIDGVVLEEQIKEFGLEEHLKRAEEVAGMGTF